jgi:hypothetical protein
MNTKLIRYLTLLIYMSFLCYGSLDSSPIPGEGESLPWQVFHNALHIPAYALLTWLLVRYFATTPRRQCSSNVAERVQTCIPDRPSPTQGPLAFLGLGTITKADLIASATIAVGYGILMEFLQGLTPERTPSLMDVGLNALGVVVVVLIYVREYRNPKSETRNNIK